MVAYNFQPRFEPAILSGAKRQTIRAHGKKRHARPGDLLQLYTGMRTSHCRKIIPDVICTNVRGISIWFDQDLPERADVVIDSDPTFGDLDDFARQDGFEDWSDLHEFWHRNHGGMYFEGALIEWDFHADQT